MDVITISRQLGSLGFQVAKNVAEHMNFRLAWRDVINKAAIRAGAPEVALAIIDEFNLLGIAPTTQKYLDYIQVMGEVIQEKAREGGIVIVGRAGQVLLRDDPAALHVRVVAPESLRVARLMSFRNITEESARAQIQTSDQTRRNYLRRFYQANWEDSSLYDLVINTGRLSVPVASDLICRTARLQGSGIGSQIVEDLPH